MLAFVLTLSATAMAQRSYKPSSVLASGNWYKVSVAAEGVYKMDAAFLSTIGLGNSIPSSQIRLFGAGGGMLPEAVSASRIDDLEELALQVQDGGDGVFNGADYILFYSSGPQQWIKDSAARSFSHRKNLYTDKAFYFLTVGGAGKRIATQPSPPTAATTVTSFDERYFHELDSVNFLSSGKQWYGEEFSALPGRPLVRNFLLPLQDLSGTAVINTSLAARSVNTASRFAVSINGSLVQQITVPAIGTGQYTVSAQEIGQSAGVPLGQPTVNLTLAFAPGTAIAQGWLNWFQVFARRALRLPVNGQLPFRDWASVRANAVQFSVAGADASTQVWDVTDSLSPVRMAAALSGSNLSFSNNATRLREYVCFANSFFTPVSEGRVANQNLHNTSAADYLIITPPQFLSQAQRLAGFHRTRNGLAVVLATTEQVFNEFAGGKPDPTAIRDYVKMYFDRYNATWASRGKSLLLFGKASFDYKNRVVSNSNLVPAYQSLSSLDPLSTYTSDDFFGFLENAEDINSSLLINTLDIGIGRIPARSEDEAKAFVDKVLDYHSATAFGPWRTNLNLIADDEDINLHLDDAEILSATVDATAPLLNKQKIYLDAFRQESGSSGGRYPTANAAINNNVNSGTLIWNYSGHGGPQRLAEEVVIDQSTVNGWTNRYRLPLFITATCDFAPFDYPLATSLGENLVLRPATGAVALMTTTRVVFAASNRIMNNNYFKLALERKPDGSYRSLGEAVQASKNLTYTTSGDVVNNRKFVLLGDPAMTLAFPKLSVAATRINGRDVATLTDTLSATEFVEMEGEVRDATGTIQTSFTGTVNLTLFDKPRGVTTLANDASSLPITYADQSSLLFRGKASATAGKFSVRFRMPKDINYQYGAGKISLYAQSDTTDGAGLSTAVSVGGIAQGAANDDQGPEIKAYLNDDRFANGGIANDAPLLLLKLADSSGINTGSSGIDHDIGATLDGDNNQYYILNNFYESELDNYQKGTVRFQLPSLTPGPHSLRIKAWDVVNNSNEYTLDFIVTNNEELRISRVLNYPNPFTTHTAFWFEHNYPGTDLYTKVDIFTVAGKRIKTVTQTINTQGNRSTEASWDGRDEWGQKVGRGVYLYRLYVKAANGKSTAKWERLVVL